MTTPVASTGLLLEQLDRVEVGIEVGNDGRAGPPENWVKLTAACGSPSDGVASCRGGGMVQRTEDL